MPVTANQLVGQTCLISREYRHSSVRTTMQVTPVRITRPAEGRTLLTTNCPRCGTQLRWTVFSERAGRRVLLRWVLLGVIGLVLFVAGVVMVAGFGEDTASGLVVLLTVLAVFGGGVLAMTGFWCAIREYGIRIDDGSSRTSRRHGVRAVPWRVREKLERAEQAERVQQAEQAEQQG